MALTSSSPGATILALDCSARSLPGIWRRRELAFSLLVSPIVYLTPASVSAAEERDNSLLDGILSVFDPNETTKSGKRLPKSYLKAAREVVKNLREALGKDPTKDEQKFREAASTAKDAIRDYLTGWKNSKAVEAESSYQNLEKALRQLGTFYLKSGPTAIMPDDIKSEILQNLSNAEVDL